MRATSSFFTSLIPRTVRAFWLDLFQRSQTEINFCCLSDMVPERICFHLIWCVLREEDRVKFLILGAANSLK